MKLVIQEHVLADGGFMATPAVEATSICSPTTMAWPAQRQKGWPQPVGPGRLVRSTRAHWG